MKEKINLFERLGKLFRLVYNYLHKKIGGSKASGTNIDAQIGFSRDDFGKYDGVLRAASNYTLAD